MIDATAAVRLAESWQGSSTTANQATAFADVLDASTIIATGAGTSFAGTADAVVLIEHVEVDINFTATGLQNSSDLLLYITAPSGTESLIFSGVGFGSVFGNAWQFTSNAFRGEDSSGVWTVRAVDNSTGANIEIDDIGITFFGSAPDDNDLFIFTNEYSDYAGCGWSWDKFRRRCRFDTINAAAVTAASTIDLAC